MKRIAAFFVAFCVCIMCTVSFADDPYRMAAFSSENQQDWSDNTFFQDREEETGISFLFTLSGEYTQWKKELRDLLSDPESSVDVVFKGDLTSSEIQEYYNADYIIDLKPYLEEYAPNLTKLLQEHPDWEKAITLPDGSIPALPSINEVTNNNSMWINKKWLEALNISEPSTREEFVEMLRAFRDMDPNVNGKKDEIPLSFVSMWDLKFLSHMFGFVMNDYGMEVAEDGKVQYMVTSDKNREFLEWLHGLWQEGLLWQDGFTSPDTMRIITDSKATKTYGMFFGATPLSLVPSEWAGDYKILMPVECNGSRTYRKLQSEVQLGAFAITPHCKNPEMLVQWVDYLYSPEGSQRAQSGKEGVDFARDSEGKWSWTDDSSTVVATIIPYHTISQGGGIPGYIDAKFQLDYEDEEAVAPVVGITSMKEYEAMPYPQVYLTDSERSRINEIQNDAGAYAEQQMVWFVTGEKELTDESWSEFCATVEEKNVGEMTQLFQQAYDRQYN